MTVIDTTARLAGALARRAARLPLGARAREQLQLAGEELGRALDPEGGWSQWIGALDRRYVEDASALPRAEKQALFKRMVRLVEFEPHAYCNRLCPFCPNVFLDRINDWTPMDFGTYEATLRDLAEIGYDGTVRFARYSEPLSCKDIGKYVSAARRALPRAHIDIVSNGDYLNKAMLAELIEAGLDTLHISIYPKGYDWNVANARAQLDKLLKRIAASAEVVVDTKERLYWRIPHERIALFAEANDLASTGWDRGQTLDDLQDQAYRRTAPCLMVFANVTVDFNGAVMPCCNLRSDVEDHKKHVVDVLIPAKSIIDVYCSAALSAWRKSLARVGPKGSPCSTCKQKTVDSPAALAYLDRQAAARLGETR